MSDRWLRRLAWGTAVSTWGLLITSAVMLSLVPDPADTNWLWNQITAFVAIGAPTLGLVIVRKQTRHPIGWLWLLWGVVLSLRTQGYAIYYSRGAQPAGYSALAYFLLWFTELANLVTLIVPSLLMLWFPHGQLLSPRWRLLYIWLFLSGNVLFLALFHSGVNWNGSDEAGGIVIENPYGWLPADALSFLIPLAFFSLVLIMILAAFSLILRYRSGGHVVRLQLRWFVVGGLSFVFLNFFPTFFISGAKAETGIGLLMSILSFSAILPLYLAIGIAILRLRLYEIDVIIRKTLQYGVLSALLALVYFGSVLVLQAIVGQATGERSPLIIVLSTLLIAALFSPLRRRLQAVIDRRFYRRKYNSRQILAQFAHTARDEVGLEELTAELLRVVEETVGPDQASVWLKSGEIRKA